MKAKNHLAVIVWAILAPLVVSAVLVALLLFVPSAEGKAAECGAGTVYDAPSDTCVVAQPPPPEAPPPPPPPPPVWVPTPHVSIGICAPIPFVSLCAGI